MARTVDHLIVLTVFAYFSGIDRAHLADAATMGWVLWLYAPIDCLFTYFFQAGPGKMLMRLRVVGETGAKLFFTQCIKRAIAVLIVGEGLAVFPLSTMALTVSAIIFYAYNTTAWDKWAGTMVISR